MKYPLCLLIINCLIPCAGAQSDKADVDPAVTRELIRQWVKTERVISDEQTSWTVEKKRMQDLLDLYQKELKLLDEELTQAGSSAALVDENKEKFETELKEYQEARQVLQSTMARLLPKMNALVARFPKPLLDELAVDIDFLSEPKALDKPRDVMKAMIAVLSTAGRFNRGITLAEETQKVSDEKKMTVNVLYLGLCRAYYTTASGDTAGIGTPGENGWAWKSQPGIADDIRRTIAVYQKSQQPQLIKLPVQIQGGGENK